MSVQQSIVGNIAYSNVTPCALVIEDDPIGPDSKLLFESFPESGIEETYSVSGYREIAADRMPQPGSVAYRGGNWSAFSLELKFRANNVLGQQISFKRLSVANVSDLLTDMEKKVRWCQALAFPMPREAKRTNERLNRVAARFNLQNELGPIHLTRSDPPIVLVVFGTFLTLRTYVTGYSIRWEHPYHPITVQPFGATITLQLQRLDEEYPDWEKIAKQAGGLPQTPDNPTIGGNVVLRNTNARLADTQIQVQNAATFSAIRSPAPGVDPARFTPARP